MTPSSKSPDDSTDDSTDDPTDGDETDAAADDLDSSDLDSLDLLPSARIASRWGDAERERERQLLGILATTTAQDPAHSRARDSLVTLHLPLVNYLARRFRDRGEPLEDLVQVGTIGLIKAVDRFEPDRGFEFSTFATPTIVGEIKRHFRDKSWAIRVPRRLQELRLSIGQATGELSQRTGRSPTINEIAVHLGISQDDVIEGIEGAAAYSTTSLDAQFGDDDSGSSMADRLGFVDPDLEGVEYRESLKPLLAALPERERQILAMRFFQGLSQSQIAAELEISQMHVSRLLAKSLASLRVGLSDDG